MVREDQQVAAFQRGNCSNSLDISVLGAESTPGEGFIEPSSHRSPLGQGPGEKGARCWALTTEEVRRSWSIAQGPEINPLRRALAHSPCGRLGRGDAQQDFIRHKRPISPPFCRTVAPGSSNPRLRSGDVATALAARALPASGRPLMVMLP